MPQGARLLFILNSGGETLILGNNSGATRCRAAVYSELWWDGGEELAELLFIINSDGMVGVINSRQ